MNYFAHGMNPFGIDVAENSSTNSISSVPEANTINEHGSGGTEVKWLLEIEKRIL